tara:strand:- start:242 stop:685 length:444 start_codon:yes stop_codon:yes gene_type:complete
METETDIYEPQTHLDLVPVKEGTEKLCGTIVSQKGFPELFKKIEAFMADEKLRHDYDMLNQRGGLLQQKHEAGMEVTEEEVAEFEKLRETLLANQTVTDFHEVQEEVQQLQDKIHQVIAKTFEIGRVPSQEDFDFCSDGFGDCGCSN